MSETDLKNYWKKRRIESYWTTIRVKKTTRDKIDKILGRNFDEKIQKLLDKDKEAKRIREIVKEELMKKK